ncbi:hypothetical protein SAY87_019587 [Trapa incisa]|uniref:ERCC4 domain-containing protein n=1 Tax=Trapa incisa TaxID=236973 RepID=A0AAN7K500_9MYRT|nr:hypothetical protein SAY87_019587 [Trapa incisa]
MLQFHEQIITDLLEEDSNGGLVIISSGLSLASLISSLLLLHSPSQGTLLLLSPSSTLKSHILHLLHQSDPSFPTPAEITADLPAPSRHSLYCSGEAVFITPRILIVDLLMSRVPTSNVAGIIIPHAHSLTETSTEAFIVRVLKSVNKNAYVRAFSDKPHSMISGFAKAERIMKSLFIKKLHLWPRFQVFVSQELEKDPSVVVDIRVPLTKHMAGIQKAIIEVMDACLKEMRKTNKVDVEDLTLENGLFKSFDEIVRRQLDPIWHTLGKKTKQLVSDLKTLRKLLDYLVRYDAVSFLKYLDTLRVSESFRSVWIFAESSYKIFELAKKRAYRFVQSNGANVNSNSKRTTKKRRKPDGEENHFESAAAGSSSTNSSSIVLEEVLEEAPKWKVLFEILLETNEERKKASLSVEEHLLVGTELDDGIVLVACKDERSCMQLEDCITKSSQKVMREEWEKYLLSKVELREAQARNKKKPKDPKGFGILDGVVPVTSAQSAEVSGISKQEHEALLAAASEIRKMAKNENTEDNAEDIAVTEGNAKGRKLRTRKGRQNNKNNHNRTGTSKKNDYASEHVSIENDQTNGADHGTADRICQRVLQENDQMNDDTQSKVNKALPPLHFYALESDQPVLDIMQPSVIIVYHPDMTFVRQIEVYKASNPSKKLKVYFLFYEESTEVQKFEASIRRENGAFESLIRQKSLMMIPVDQDGRCVGLNPSLEPQPSSLQNSITRKAGGRKDVDKQMQIIVDMREFMSSLPNVLHQKGMRIIPVTLEVGDYILSPLICVERKSIQDLFSSFTSGRLYHQVETMVRYYRIPVLLIEFSQDKSFSFQSSSDIGDDVTPTNIISKLSLLVLHFPRLRIIWSRSLHATAEIFFSLKANQDEPDETKAMRIGVPSEDGFVENDVRAESYNTSAVEFLRRLPGVTDSNYRAIMDGCNSLAELVLLPVDRLAELMGGQKAARTLRDFLDAKYPTLL